MDDLKEAIKNIDANFAKFLSPVESFGFYCKADDSITRMWGGRESPWHYAEAVHKGCITYHDPDGNVIGVRMLDVSKIRGVNDLPLQGFDLKTFVSGFAVAFSIVSFIIWMILHHS